ncbi:hypothetical protein NQ315_011669, partial [Exocentrus adspersus]
MTPLQYQNLVDKKLSEDVSNEFRIRSKLILEKPLKIKSNINKEEMLSLKHLKNDKNIKILPADKGNATVIMNTIDYNIKILNMITEEKLTTINLNPTDLLVNFDVRIWPHGQDSLTQFLNFLNNIEPTIKFTLELEENNKLPFLDVMVSKNVQETSNFQTNVYRKKTSINRYLNFDSNHHLSVKK